jgi:hypothetical protein
MQLKDVYLAERSQNDQRRPRSVGGEGGDHDVPIVFVTGGDQVALGLGENSSHFADDSKSTNVPFFQSLKETGPVRGAYVSNSAGRRAIIMDGAEPCNVEEFACRHFLSS